MFAKNNWFVLRSGRTATFGSFGPNCDFSKGMWNHCWLRISGIVHEGKWKLRIGDICILIMFTFFCENLHVYANTRRFCCCAFLHQDVFLVCFVCQPLGAVDYLEMSRHFDTVLIRDVPRMNLEKKVAARRFITLIDTLYDHRVSQRQCHF